MLCKICNSEMDLDQVVKDCIFMHAAIRTKPYKAPNKDIEIFYCPNCTHRQTSVRLDKDFYEAYMMDAFTTAIFVTRHLDLTNERFIKLKKYAKNNDKIIDIGCGIGLILKEAQKFFKTTMGIEPSKSEFEIASASGLNVINKYFEKTLNFNNEFSSFIATQVFEHLENPKEILEAIYDSLIEGGSGLINVPDGQNIFDSCIYTQIIHEHLNYYSPMSLMMLAKETGFEVMEIQSIDYLNEIDFYVRKPSKKVSFSDKKERDKKQVSGYLKNCINITIWGAGSKSHHYIQLIHKSAPIKHIIDFSKDKHGKFITNLDIPIEDVDQHIIDESDAIIIFASGYNQEILDDLENKYNFNGKIIFFDDEVKCKNY